MSACSVAWSSPFICCGSMAKYGGTNGSGQRTRLNRWRPLVELHPAANWRMRSRVTSCRRVGPSVTKNRKFTRLLRHESIILGRAAVKVRGSFGARGPVREADLTSEGWPSRPKAGGQGLRCGFPSELRERCSSRWEQAPLRCLTRSGSGGIRRPAPAGWLRRRSNAGLWAKGTAHSGGPRAGAGSVPRGAAERG